MKPKSFFIVVIPIVFIVSSCNPRNDKGPIVSYQKRILDVGEVKLRETNTAHIYLKNVGDQNLKIGNIKADCACTVANVEKKVVLPHDSTEIIFKLTPKTTGRLQQTIFIENNSKNEPGIMFLIRARVILDTLKYTD